MGEFFQALNDEERKDIAARTDVNAALLRAWVQYYTGIRPQRIPAVAMLTAAVAPRTTPADALPTMQLSFWIFGVDDLADERLITLDELRQRSRLWHSAALIGMIDNRQPEAGDELTSMLLEVRSALARHRLFTSLRQQWALEVRRLVDAMAQEYQAALEYQAQGPAALPDMETYLAYATYSIGVPLWAIAVWIVAQDDSILDQLDLIQAATRHASQAVRLYNDLISLDKELQENTINAVLITRQTTGHASWDEAKQSVRQLAAACGQACLTLTERIHTDSGKIEETLRRTVEFHADFYRDHDYNTTSLNQVAEILTNQNSEVNAAIISA